MSSTLRDGPLATIAFCWTVERRDGAGLALTSHDRNLMIEGRVHRAAPGMVPAAIERKLGLAESDGEIAGALTSMALSEEDLSSGRWDGARVRLAAVDWENTGEQAVILIAGELGEIEIGDSGFRAALRGATAALSKPVCPETSSECRAKLGDSRCGIDMAGRSRVAQVVEGSGRILSVDEVTDARFLWGEARLLTGRNTGWTSAIVAVEGQTVTLRDAPPAAIEQGSKIRLSQGCDKLFATCRDRFANAANFRGEPHLPGNDLLTRFPGA